MKTLDSWNRAGKVLANIDAQDTSNISRCTGYFTRTGFCCCCFPVPLPKLQASLAYSHKIILANASHLFFNLEGMLGDEMGPYIYEKGLGKLPEESPSCLL